MRPLIAGNWKMNGTISEALSLIDGIAGGIGEVGRGADILVMPPFTALSAVSHRLSGRGVNVGIGAQDLHWEERGAFTGEVSAAMLRDVGCTHVLVGHSERRALFGEGGDALLKKLRAALRSGLVPILCIGERLEEREAARTQEVLDTQLGETLLRVGGNLGPVVLAYEPVWAIGTGRNATPAQISDAHRHIRSRLVEALGEEQGTSIGVLYGGSVNSGNAREILACPEVGGALVGGASLRADEFLEIARAVPGPAGHLPPAP